MAMGTSDVCPTEDAILALLDYLVDPMLPARYSRDNPTKVQHQAVAKQVPFLIFDFVFISHKLMLIHLLCLKLPFYLKYR